MRSLMSVASRWSIEFVLSWMHGRGLVGDALWGLRTSSTLALTRYVLGWWFSVSERLSYVVESLRDSILCLVRSLVIHRSDHVEHRQVHGQQDAADHRG